MTTVKQQPAAANPPHLQRPPVPWPVRALDRAGSLLGRMGNRFTNLDEAALCEAACRKTGLSDFGDERFREGLRVFVQGAAAVEKYAFVGRFVMSAATSRALRNRLLIEQQIKEHPEILGLTVPRPLVVVGMPRTGTTLLQNLLTQDTAARPLLVWEAASPAKPRLDNRQRDMERMVWIIKRAYPQINTLHVIEANGPQECGPLFRNAFFFSPFQQQLARWADEIPYERLEWAYQQYHRQLQLLQWQRPAQGHWLLKFPMHLIALDVLLKTLPEAVVVQTHRDPVRVVPSFCQLTQNLAFFFGDARAQALPREVQDLIAVVVRRAMEARQRIPAERVIDVHYRQLLTDPMGVLRRIYQHFGYHYTDELESRAQRWLAEHPKRERAGNYYDLAQFGLDRAELEQTFAEYSAHYQIEPES